MKCKWWKVFFLLVQIVLDVYAATHWVVTENGRIQSQVGEILVLGYVLIGLSVFCLL